MALDVMRDAIGEAVRDHGSRLMQATPSVMTVGLFRRKFIP